MTVNGIDVTVKGLPDVSSQEITNYINYVETKTQEKISRLHL